MIDHWSDVINDPVPTTGDKAVSSVSYRLPDPSLASFTLSGKLNLFALGGINSDALYGNDGDNAFETTGTGTYFDTAYGAKGNDIYLTRTTSDDVTPAMDPASLGLNKGRRADGGGSRYLPVGLLVRPAAGERREPRPRQPQPGEHLQSEVLRYVGRTTSCTADRQRAG